MITAYVDSSVLVAIEFRQHDTDALIRRLEQYQVVTSSNLLEAEYRSACWRESWTPSNLLLAAIDWIIPSRPLEAEFNIALAAGYLRGSDLWHVATALYAATAPKEISFVTTDIQQGRVAAKLGFDVWPEPESNRGGVNKTV